ncbi:gamma-glutamyltranspeptidase/glutathione hydrolase [Bradyrhizobium japonicum]|jgi:gamma-glutamyltranspeptidase / glutathione hydrolase|uniref:Glutathione hydrolase proenzyme n=1 Tax=Bradyrhizobium elkanii TaxID=29448 RepID=A0A4Q4K624_BRAEL|nr:MULTISPECIES: gamma-glutamyltransferase [Bradyrhizobium]MBP1298293.1 gamma-glutamyltranspeptidase/glutathione hydrolase [Bradyrhizobium elkanii]MCP1730438.1 gamma-glutamyltranspeptidase/glutathione hydrolase [Bradyrhizobium elkanii]MCP1930901.1 gamma-glutamyltranspeptidase/glutathione hydrolase [Bradyrhizobium elkanii]MCS3480881.1 gamma-glutamyltranspeptidase/glutathione hydrolase [Bradyrhizobium elkanii]MCS3517689.1 gamma-glutamyltranspeptidase/glutathione hydrolase [Bradyrhizobium elkanii
MKNPNARARWMVAALVSIAIMAPGPGHAASVAPVAAENGMVVSAQHLATQVGVEVLKRGGNAVDAAVAVGYALAVAYPAAGNLGGGGFMTIQFADGRKTFLDFRETAPKGATADMYLDKEGKIVAGLSTKGHLAVGVPGSVAGMEYAREKYGTMKRADVIAPALQLAEDGFVLDRGDIQMLDSAVDDLRQDPPSAAIFLNNGKPFQVGERLTQHELAETLREISKRGTDGFYKGWVGAAIVAASQGGKGLLTQEDLDNYRVRELAPVECDYRGYHVVSAPPPSSGGVVICEMLNILEGYPLKELGYHSAQAVHYQIEAMRHAYVDRNSYLGDPDFVKNPLERLLDKTYAAKIRAAIDPAKAGVSRDIRPGVPPHEGSNTTHYSIADKDGNAVSVTYTLNDWFGAKVTAAKTGVLLNDEMDDFTAKVGVPNLYGLVQGEANAIVPGKRPLSSMSPTIVSKDGKPVIVMGTPGGSRIITAVLLTMINAIDYGMNAQEAVDMPRFHQQWLPEATNLEDFTLSPDTRKILEGMGHKFGPPQPANHLAVIIVGAPSLGGKPVGNNRFYGANDPRRNSGLAAGY